jgi:PAS domain S-box-containing protein
MQKGAGINFQQLFESAPGLNLILKPDLTIVAVSDAYLLATMTKRGDITGKGLFDVFPDNPDDPSATGESNLRASLMHVLKSKTAHTMAVQKYDIRRPDGSFEERYWSPINKPVFNDDNEIELIIHRVEDVTEFVNLQKDGKKQLQLAEDLRSRMQEMENEIYKRALEIQETNSKLETEINEHKKLQEELKASQLIFSTIFYESPVMNLIADAKEGRYIDLNEKFAQFCGYTREEMIGKTSPELSMMPQFQQRNAFMNTIREQGFARDVLMEATNRYGEKKWISTSGHAININGRQCFITAMVEVTERKLAEEKIRLSEAALQRQAVRLEEANKELEAFSYSVSHDLRAPLRIIHGYTEIISKDYSKDLEEEGKRMLGIVNKNVRKMGQLIDDLLNLSRLGRQEINVYAINMGAMVKTVIAELAVPAKKMPQIQVNHIEDIDSDASLLHQVWINLISNAIKYSSTRENPVVEISSEKKGDEIIYHVKDNGVGFNMKYAGKLFGVFQRLHGINEFEGTGVGLALVHRIISRLGGRVWAEAELDNGATFSFSLPAIQKIDRVKKTETENAG